MSLRKSRQVTRVIDRDLPRPEEPTGTLANPFSKYTRYISHVERIELDAEFERAADDLRLAFVSLSMPPLKSRLLPGAPAAPRCAQIDLERRLVKYGRKVAGPIRSSFEEALRVAVVEEQANVVCVNELGLPSWGQKPMKRALKYAHTLAIRHECVIVAGSSHDRRTCFNTARIFYPGCPKSGSCYHKQVSATSSSVGEHISVPPDRRTVFLRFRGFNLMILICLDVLDFSSVAAVVKMSEQVDMLLVPCYSKKMEPMLEAAELASAAMPGEVFLVNRYEQSIEAVRASFGSVEPFDSERDLKGRARIHLLRCNREAFRGRKDDLKRGPKRDIAWLFGVQDLVPK